VFGIDPSRVLSGRAPSVRAPLGDLGRNAALSLMSTCRVGRIAFTAPDGIRIVPVNFVLRDDPEVGVEVVEIRTTSSSELAVHAPGQQVAFEADQIDATTRSGWSVLVRGECERDLGRFGETTRLGEVRADPWADGRRPMVLRVVARTVTGKVVGLGEWDRAHR
jgi:uncharacterized protein